MIATTKKMLDQEPSEIEMMLPWYAAGTLSAGDARCVEEALARDPELAKEYAVIRGEYAETIGLNESLGVPSTRAMQKLFAAIDAEPAGRPAASLNPIARFAGIFAKLSPRTLAWSASLAAVALVLQASVIGAVLLKNHTAAHQTVALSMNMNEPAVRDSGSEAPPRALVRFAPEARVADITALLESRHASIIGGAAGGMFRLQFGNKPMTKDEIADLMGRLQREKIVSLAVATP